MTENEWTICITDPSGAGRQLRNVAHERLVYVIADEVSLCASRWHRKGRPDVAGRLRWIEGQLRHSGRMTKGPLTKCRRQLEEVRAKLVDGVSEAGL